jgi:hypothetical protein
MSVEWGKRDYIDQLYDSFPVKDITRSEFRRRYIVAMDPIGARRAAAAMIDKVHTGRMIQRKVMDGRKV